jgi:hypothetical protein
MCKRIFRKLKLVYKFIHPRITIKRQSNFHFDFDTLQLVIVRQKLEDGKPFNSVWLIGEHKNILHKLYHWSGKPNSFAKTYGINMRKFNYWIEVQRPHKLSVLCRRCKIKKVLIIQKVLPSSAYL